MASYRKAANGKTKVEICVNGKRAYKTFGTLGLAEAWASRQEEKMVGMADLKAALEDHKISSIIPARMLNALKKANYSAAEIISSAFPVDAMSGIYFLISKEKIRYVGQTKNLFDRLRRHFLNGRKFDSFAFIPCPHEQLDELEEAYILITLPEENDRLGPSILRTN